MAKILIVEDDELTLRLLMEYLGAHEYELVTAEDGEEGLKKFRQEQFDLVITGIEMPGMDGAKMAEKMKSYMPTPILIVSGYSPDDLPVASLCHFDGYLVKPISLSEIKEAIDGLLGMSGTGE